MFKKVLLHAILFLSICRKGIANHKAMLEMLPVCHDKYRRRKVFAKRDFPEGCGPLARPVDGKPRTDPFRATEPGPLDRLVPEFEKASWDHGEFSDGEKSQKHESLAFKGSLISLQQYLVGSSEGLHQLEGVDSVKATLVHDIKNEVENLVAAIKLEDVELSKESLEMPKSPDLTKGQEAAGGVISKIYCPPRRRRVSATREFPPGCGRIASSNNTKIYEKVCDEDSKTFIEKTSSYLGNEEETICKSEQSDLKQQKELGVKEINGELKSELMSQSNLNWTNSEHTEKKVLGGAASRNMGERVKEIGGDFSVCDAAGSNLKANTIGDLTEKKGQPKMATGVKLKSINLKPVNKKLQIREAQEGMLSQLDEKSKPRSEAVGKETLNAVRKPVKANFRIDIKSRKRELFEVSEQKGTIVNCPSLREEPMSWEVCTNRLIVQALMATPNCPWRQGKRSRVGSAVPK